MEVATTSPGLRPQDGDTEESEKDSQDEVIIKNDSILDKIPRGKRIGSELPCIRDFLRWLGASSELS